MKGTPTYMAPEILSKEKCTKTGYVYAFSFIVYGIMTIRDPIQKKYQILN